MSRAATRFRNDLRYLSDTADGHRYLTPDYVLTPARFDLGGTIDLDPCTEPSNPTDARRFFTAVDDGLAQSWDAMSIWCNPPYGKSREPWVECCVDAGSRRVPTILLIPADTDTKIWQRAALSASAVVFVEGRVKFGVVRRNGRQEAASHGSSLIGWNTDLGFCSALGLRMVLR